MFESKQMRRREFIGLGIVAAAWLCALCAQSPARIRRIAFVHPSRPIDQLSEKTAIYRPFFEELRRRGYVEGRNLIIDRYTGEGQIEPFPELTRMVISAKPESRVQSSASRRKHNRRGSRRRSRAGDEASRSIEASHPERFHNRLSGATLHVGDQARGAITRSSSESWDHTCSRNARISCARAGISTRIRQP